MSSITTTTKNNVTSLPTPSKASTAKALIAENIKLLIAQLEAGHSEGLTAYLTAMGRFHNYSFGNILEIARQRPDATRVAGLYAWNKLGRKVKKGERSIRILAPVIGVRKKKDKEAEKDVTRENQPVLVGFRSAAVFDVSQTEGADLPRLSARVQVKSESTAAGWKSSSRIKGIAHEFKESMAPALGMSYGAGSTSCPDRNQPRSSAPWSTKSPTMLHKAERRTATTRTVRETEAEAIAFVVSQTIGLDAGRASADYIHLYHGNAALLTESLEVIQRTSALILSAIEPPAVKAQEDATNAAANVEVA